MQKLTDFEGAVVNENQLYLLLQMFGLHPWSYINEDPFELRQKLEEQERAMGELNLS